MFSILLLIFQCVLFLPTGETLPYADGVLPAEIILLIVLAAIEAFRLFFGKR